MKQTTLFLSLLLAFTIQAQTGSKLLHLEDFTLNRTFSERDVTGISAMKDDSHYTRLLNGRQIVKYSYSQIGDTSVIFDVRSELLQDAKLNNIDGYAFSADEQFILVYTGSEKIYRRSYTAEYWLYDVRRKRIEPVEAGKRQQMATLSPDGKRLAFARDNNLFIKDLRFGTILQITDDGLKNSIINGIPDWVYEEEFTMNKAFEWSPDGQFLAYLKFDESEVKEYSFPLYRGSYPTLKRNALYPDEYRYKYPKAGETNATVSVQVYNTQNRVTHHMDVSDETDLYIPRIRWTATSEALAVFTFNRHQDEFKILLANPKSGLCRMVLKETNTRYITENNLDYITFLEDNEHFVFVSEQDGYNHIYLYRTDGQLVKKLTNGKWDVTDYYGYDAKRKLFYYQAAAKSALGREVYSVDLKGEKVNCLTMEAGTSSALYSSGYSYFIKKQSTIRTPLRVTVCNQKGENIRTLEDNRMLRKRLENTQFTEKDFFTFTTGSNDLLNGWILKPSSFDATKKYPVLMVQYSGPGSQEVLDKWDFGWEHYLASMGYVVACVDGRGTGGRGEEFKKCTYLNLGNFESADQIETARYLGALPYVDSNKIGIWGWSYGGFMSALCLSRGSGLFKMGIAVAPVTHYKFYDSIYTERFMRTYGENPKGYDDNSPLMLADKLEGELLICHGSADDNVHYQNTMEYAEALVQAGKQFEMQVYNNRNHSIYGGNTRQHIFTRMFNYMERTLK